MPSIYLQKPVGNVFEAALSRALRCTPEFQGLQKLIERRCDPALITAEDLGDSGPEILYCNAAFAALFGFEPTALSGRPLGTLLDGKAGRDKLLRFKKRLVTRREAKTTLNCNRKCGAVFAADMLAGAMPTTDAGAVYAALVREHGNSTPALRTDDILTG